MPLRARHLQSHYAGLAYAEVGKRDKALPQLRFYVQNADTGESEDKTDKVIETRFVIAQMLAAHHPDEALMELESIRPLLADAYGADSTHVRNLDRQLDRLRQPGMSCSTLGDDAP
ncbi:MAG TPA: hypothetical protein VIW24_07290 [Aldersonia sp.]